MSERQVALGRRHWPVPVLTTEVRIGACDGYEEGPTLLITFGRRDPIEVALTDDEARKVHRWIGQWLKRKRAR